MINHPRFALLLLSLTLALLGSGCNKEPESDPKGEAPPPLKLQRVEDRSVFEVERPELFPVAKAVAHRARPQLNVTGTVNPDISRNVPVITLASGRVFDVRARLGDTVIKGQLLMRVQSADIASAYSDYQQALADEELARKQLERSKLLYERGAIARKELEVAQATEDKAKVTVKTTTQRLQVLGVDPLHPSAIVDITAPVSGVITDQQVTNASGVQALSSTNPFTISDLSHVWIICDVFEDDLANVRLGDHADIRVSAYPDRVLTGTISNIGPILDPNIRSAKVRIQVENPGTLRPGMFVTATFHGLEKVTTTAVPATAILHLQDLDWVYVPVQGKAFRRAEVVGGDMLTGGMQEVVSGLSPGQPVVSNALELQHTVQR